MALKIISKCQILVCVPPKAAILASKSLAWPGLQDAMLRAQGTDMYANRTDTVYTIDITLCLGSSKTILNKSNIARFVGQAVDGLVPDVWFKSDFSLSASWKEIGVPINHTWVPKQFLKDPKFGTDTKIDPPGPKQEKPKHI